MFAPSVHSGAHAEAVLTLRRIYRIDKKGLKLMSFPALC
jgi:hypothetical protein